MNLPTLISSLRALTHDGPTSKVIFAENLGEVPGFPVDGSNALFRLKNAPVVKGSVFATVIGTSQRTQAGFALTDEQNGIVSFNPAPGNGVVVSMDYNYYWFNDNDYAEFISQASENLNLNVSPPDPTLVAPGLIPAMMQFALGNFFRARASQYADRYASSGGEAGQSVESVAKAFISMASSADKLGATKRDEFYNKQGQKNTPAYSSPSSHPSPGFDPITPPR